MLRLTYNRDVSVLYFEAAALNNQEWFCYSVFNICQVRLNSLLRCTQTSELGLKQTVIIIGLGLWYDCLVMVELARRKWPWVGYILRKNSVNITNEAMSWTPDGKREQGKPRIKWRRTAEKELASVHLS